MSCQGGCSGSGTSQRPQMTSMYTRPPPPPRPRPITQQMGRTQNVPAMRQMPMRPPGPPDHQHHDHNHHHHRGHVPGRDDLVEHVMEDFGDGGLWNESSAVSLQDFESSGAEDSERCPPCEENEPPPSHRTSRKTEKRSRKAHDAPEMGVCVPCEEGESLANIEQAGPTDSSFDVASMVNAPSNISVFDAEELNITTAPRNADWDIPRNRIWQTLSSSLDETEQLEEDEYLEFVSNIQNERREFFGRE